uniref:Phosphoglycerate mutase gpmB n=1 Tax=Aegilops tauschii subsp. strangulata TaxID=200361 RepID=A0A453KAS7_AEGTS
MPPATLQHGGDDGEWFAEVVVVRHGETSWNASRIVQGQMDPQLNETGRQQAVVLVLDPALRERHMGDLHGLAFDDAVRRNPEIFSSYSRTQEIPVTSMLPSEFSQLFCSVLPLLTWKLC